MSKKQQSITLSCSPQEKQNLETIALELGYKWGDNPNISALIKAIALGKIQVRQPTSRDQLLAVLSETIAKIDLILKVES